MSFFSRGIVVALVATFLSVTNSLAVDQKFHNAPDSAKATKNPFEGQKAAVAVGKRLYGRNCLSCHGRNGQGSGNVPSLVDGKLESVPSGEVFWFITMTCSANGWSLTLRTENITFCPGSRR